MNKPPYRLALDIGTNSIGWCAYRLDEDGEPAGVLRIGSRVFSDGRNPKNLASLAQDRRAARQARRRRDRVLKRRRRIIEGLMRFGLWPADEGERKKLLDLDPYALRARALDEPLAPSEIGRALYHLSRKRGFRSSRKDRGDSEKEREVGKVNSAISLLRAKVAETRCRTVGEYLAKQHSKRLPVRARRAADGQYVLYLQRGMVQEEFEAIWAAQRPHHAKLLTPEAREFLLDALLFQRKLKPVSPGKCLFEPEEFRARLCAPLQQRFRILQELNNLRLINPIGERRLTLEERNLLANQLYRSPDLTFAKARTLLGIQRGDPTRFNLESEKRARLKGDIVSSQLAAEGAIGPEWYDWDEARQQALAQLVEAADDDGELVAMLSAPPWNLAQERANSVSRCRLPEDFGSLSLKALRRIVPELEKDVITYDEAVVRAGYGSHSDLYTGEIFGHLPYYGEVLQGYTSPTESAKNPEEARFGKIPNPTVHIGLNQLRQLINALIRRYGPPAQIVVELTREFGASAERRRETERQQADNQSRNERLDEELKRLGQRTTRDNRQKLMLWEELGRDDAMDRRCVYSGRQLSKTLLFSDEVEVDHVLPFSRSLHDGLGNKVLCTRQANRDKGNRTPYEAFGHSPGMYRWDKIAERAGHLAGRKPLLFQPDALEAFLDGRDFLDRQLIDTGYLGRAAKRYLSAVCPPHDIWVTSGRLTGLLRARWRLASLLWEDSRKNRDDHRHHALDAAVIGLCSRSLIQRLATAAARAEERGENRLLERLDLPWPDFRDNLKACLERVVVSHKPDHGREAQLHNDTNYGWRGEPDSKGAVLVARRVPIESLTTTASLEGVADPRIKAQLKALLASQGSGKEVAAALRTYSEQTGIRRILKEERLSVIPIADRRTGQPYRYVKGDSNFCYEVYHEPDGSWGGIIISTFQANRPGFAQDNGLASNGRPLVMRIHRGDMLMISDSGIRKVVRVAKISEGMIALAQHFEANVDARNRSKSDPFKYMYKTPSSLQKVHARPVGVCPLGYVNIRSVKP